MLIFSIFLTFFLVAFLTTFFVVPKIRRFSIVNNYTDYPNERKLHTNPIPRLGGFAIFFGSIFSYLVGFLLFREFFVNSIDFGILIALLLGGFSFFLIGIFDDIKSLSPWKRLFFQIFFSIILWNSGLSIRFLDLSWFNFTGDTLQIYNILSLIITVFWISGVTNSINWIDGLDGLAIGIAFISSIGFFLISLGNNQILACVLALNIAGSCLGFWFHNSHPASIFMGDGGSYYIGFNLAILGIIASSSNYIDNSRLVINPIFGFLILSLPIGDMAYVIFRRIQIGNSPFYPDCMHLHHRLMTKGLNSKITIQIIYFLTLLGSIAALTLKYLVFE